MSHKVAHIKEQGIEERSKKIIQTIAFNWQHSILKLFDNFFEPDSLKFCAWVLNSAENEEFDRGSRIDLQKDKKSVTDTKKSSQDIFDKHPLGSQKVTDDFILKPSLKWSKCYYLIYMLKKVEIEMNKIYNLYLNIVNVKNRTKYVMKLHLLWTFVFICKALESIFTIDVDTE